MSLVDSVDWAKTKLVSIKIDNKNKAKYDEYLID